jgi:malate dehydrogenase
VNDSELGLTQTLMAMETTLGSDGVSWAMPKGTKEEIAELRASAKHLAKLRDEVIGLGVLPPLDAWGDTNPNL